MAPVWINGRLTAGAGVRRQARPVGADDDDPGRRRGARPGREGAQEHRPSHRHEQPRLHSRANMRKRRSEAVRLVHKPLRVLQPCATTGRLGATDVDEVPALRRRGQDLQHPTTRHVDAYGLVGWPLSLVGEVVAPFVSQGRRITSAAHPVVRGVAGVGRSRHHRGVLQPAPAGLTVNIDMKQLGPVVALHGRTYGQVAVIGPCQVLNVLAGKGIVAFSRLTPLPHDVRDLTVQQRGRAEDGVRLALGGQ